VILSAGLLLFSTMLAGPVLKLKDNRELKGVDLYSDGDLYMLEIAGGSVIPIPKGVVKEVQWIDEGNEPVSGTRREPIVNQVTGRTEAEQREAEDRRAARDKEQEAWSAEQRAEEERLAKEKQEADKAARESMYGSYGQPSAWGGGVTIAGPDIRPPTTAEQLAVFGEPAKFAQDVVHFDNGPSYWVPDPVEAMGSPSTFMQPPRDSTWVPTDGFAKDAAK
jgi:hypothetical protein